MVHSIVLTHPSGKSSEVNRTLTRDEFDQMVSMIGSAMINPYGDDIRTQIPELIRTDPSELTCKTPLDFAYTPYLHGANQMIVGYGDTLTAREAGQIVTVRMAEEEILTDLVRLGDLTKYTFVLVLAPSQRVIDQIVEIFDCSRVIFSLVEL